MALEPSGFETKLKSVFASMQDGSKTDAWMASRLAGEIKNYILIGLVSTVDTGEAPAGSYAGSGTGTMAIDGDSLADALKTTFEAAYGNDDLAAHTAADIDAACTVNGTVSAATKGTVTTPAGVSSAFTGEGTGKFTGDKTVIETTLKACFAAMNGMTGGGDDYYAAQLAAAVDAYLKAGSVSVTLQPPFVSGSGKGTIA
jgi:hypothetical protein